MFNEHISDEERKLHDAKAELNSIDVGEIDWTTRQEKKPKVEGDDTPELIWDLPKADADSILDKEGNDISPEEAAKLDEIRRQLYESHHRDEKADENLEQAA